MNRKRIMSWKEDEVWMRSVWNKEIERAKYKKKNENAYLKEKVAFHLKNIDGYCFGINSSDFSLRVYIL